MDELIKRRDALEAIAQLALPYHIQRERILDALQKVPAADAVEVVRCRDCKHAIPICKEVQKAYCHPPFSCRVRLNPKPVNSDDFCSYGERRQT